MTLTLPRRDDIAIYDITLGLFVSPAMLIAHRAGLFRQLDGRPSTLGELCAALGLARRPAEALVNIAVALGFVRRDADRYALTTLGEDLLVERSPTYFGAFFDLMYEASDTFSLKSLETAIRDDAAHPYGSPDVFQSHEQQDELAKRFTRAMESASAVHAPVWPTKLDLSMHRVMLDIGGGSGVHTRGALSAWPALHGILFELPNVCELSRPYFEKSSVRERVALHPGDMLHDPFPDADLHFYSNVFHAWPREEDALLARKSFEALPPGGRIVLHEVLYRDDKSGPLAAAASSLMMISWTEGEQYSSHELSAILTDAGFSSIETIPSSGYYSLVTGVKH
ncbi:methyltransferase [Burkholderia oklahomensis]|uniref:methyltransferase n=1 Tax=Burkholderia oklahomensis TaxID=342113 RepID=UPI000474166F|nr:methyltransferase [Burkholderia oklahomensis]AOI50308.1 methyltransferase [Burkholderia oklahomensis C6786]KUY51629.1 methyltransferase [Burkholderia oklahomensis C6786]MBI0361904.1 methyltransferase [Burkholderia oklahomensis]SUY28853.1 Multifunctional cyclase-dehydratase-3-O-methyl transferase tcmN [Burkholderia oklahomensis]